jgi:hypothetical protein
MKCQACQTELLAAADPERPSREVAEHLAGCPVCQEWQRQILLIERSVSRIPAPPSRACEALVQRLLQPAGPPAAPAAYLPPALPRPRSRWRLPTLGVAGLVAAALLIACGILLGNYLARSIPPADLSPQAQAPEEAAALQKPADTRKTNKQGIVVLAPAPAAKKEPPAPASPLTARLLACDLALAEADSPGKRLEALVALADELQGETKALADAAGAEDLRTLARLYEKVIREGIVPGAGSVRAGERRAVLGPIASRLVRTRRDLRELARRSGPTSAGPLLQIAAAAEVGGRRLRDLMREGTP